MTNIDTVGEKIENALRSAKSVPGSKLTFGFFLGFRLNDEDFKVLDVYKAKHGEEAANEWLSNVMVRSGRYASDNEGNVSAL